MNKLLKVVENTFLGVMVNGGFYLTMEDISIKAIAVTVGSFYIMTIAILMQED